jgi:hypothetical protein
MVPRFHCHLDPEDRGMVAALTTAHDLTHTPVSKDGTATPCGEHRQPHLTAMPSTRRQPEVRAMSERRQIRLAARPRSAGRRIGRGTGSSAGRRPAVSKPALVSACAVLRCRQHPPARRDHAGVSSPCAR